MLSRWKFPSMNTQNGEEKNHLLQCLQCRKTKTHIDIWLKRYMISYELNKEI